MIYDKICFIHLRPQDPQNYQQVALKGGYTVAWVVDGDNGDIIVGQPARCQEIDAYNRTTGADLARRNILERDALVVIPQSEYADRFRAEAEAFKLEAVSPAVNDKLRAILIDSLKTKPAEAISSRTLESIVRYFVVHDTTMGNNELFYREYDAVNKLPSTELKKIGF